VRRDEIDAALLQAFPERSPVIAAIGDEPLGQLARHSLGERGFGERGFSGTGRGKVHSERNTLAGRAA
jgi:hypothetical protein